MKCLQESSILANSLFINNSWSKLFIIISIETPAKLLSEMIFKTDSSCLQLSESILMLLNVGKQICETGHQKVVAGNNVYKEVLRNLLHLKQAD